MRDETAAGAGATGPADAPGHVDLIELIFFSYRDFVGDADQLLARFGFGRAHHRVLHFVERNPGMRVTDLLDLLRITKQSLGRVLKQLVDEGYIVQTPGEVDRRQRLLTTTPRGSRLARELIALQSRRIDHALASLSPAEQPAVRRFLEAMIGGGEGAPPADDIA
ncbi:MarR family protein [Methylobrevis pamukkalensis]|uniref:MarR family protein n=2 Tax=Methylobrevis pamukkalensis TaxID=1439726 RepID=A0A1E3H586_9HYPH|nr:MarR family protein [Methylobrevis pamukkalensis]